MQKQPRLETAPTKQGMAVGTAYAGAAFSRELFDPDAAMHGAPEA